MEPQREQRASRGKLDAPHECRRLGGGAPVHNLHVQLSRPEPSAGRLWVLPVLPVCYVPSRPPVLQHHLGVYDVVLLASRQPEGVVVLRSVGISSEH